MKTATNRQKSLCKRDGKGARPEQARQRFEHYELVMGADGMPVELGRGAMGVTYKAFDADLHCPVTLKVIREKYLGDESARLRFLRATLCRLNRKYLGAVERGERNVTFSILCTICVALNCDLAALPIGIPEFTPPLSSKRIMD